MQHHHQQHLRRCGRIRAHPSMRRTQGVRRLHQVNRRSGDEVRDTMQSWSLLHDLLGHLKMGAFHDGALGLLVRHMQPMRPTSRCLCDTGCEHERLDARSLYGSNQGILRSTGERLNDSVRLDYLWWSGAAQQQTQKSEASSPCWWYLQCPQQLPMNWIRPNRHKRWVSLIFWTYSSLYE